jgi:hypothetical protein
MRPRNTPENSFGITSNLYVAAVGPGNLQGVLAYRYRDSIEVDLVSQVPDQARVASRYWRHWLHGQHR